MVGLAHARGGDDDGVVWAFVASAALGLGDPDTAGMPRGEDMLILYGSPLRSTLCACAPASPQTGCRSVDIWVVWGAG